MKILRLADSAIAAAINIYAKRLNRNIEQAKKEYWRKHYHDCFGTPENYAKTMDRITGENKDG
ncbi:hypothetical protein ACI2I3_00730 [Psychrobacter namhaensis]|uniref:Uncharacterized protein n=1 Tax=Psychrobacter namhaensis TaxID=292734 RepID=A0ABW8L7K4_9GAMM